jgi:hypothetical protein
MHGPNMSNFVEQFSLLLGCNHMVVLLGFLLQKICPIHAQALSDYTILFCSHTSCGSSNGNSAPSAASHTMPPSSPATPAPAATMPMSNPPTPLPLCLSAPLRFAARFQRFNAPTLQRSNASTLQRFNAPTPTRCATSYS